MVGCRRQCCQRAACLTPVTAILRLCNGIATAREGILMPQGSILTTQRSIRTLHGSILMPLGSILACHGIILIPQGSLLIPQGSLLACQASIRMPREGMWPRHAPALSLFPWPLAGRVDELVRHAAPIARGPAGPAGRPTSRRGTAGVTGQQGSGTGFRSREIRCGSSRASRVVWIPSRSPGSRAAIYNAPFASRSTKTPSRWG